MMLRGKVWCLGDNVDTDMIISGKYLGSMDPSFLAEHCFETLEKGWARRINKGDVLVVGKNFGCGSSREHAAMALKAIGISCIIGESFGAIFFRNAINLAIPLVELEYARDKLREGQEVEVHLESNIIRNLTTGEDYGSLSLPQVILDILKSGGLLSYVAQK